MGYFKRAFYSMKYRKGTNIVLILAYTAIFALTLGILLVYLSMSSQVDYLQKALGCAVTIRTNVNDFGTPRGGIEYCDISQEDGDAFVDSPYVESYNKVGYIETGLMENGLEPVVRDSNLGLYEYQTMNGTGHTIGYMGNCLVVPVTWSEPYDLFTVYGFSLIEGRHFTAEDTDAIIISRQLAERNGLKIGDQMTISSGYFAQEHFYESEDDIQHVTLTICGLMDVPEAKELGYLVEAVDSDPYNIVLTSYEATKILTNVYAPEPKLQWVTAYLKSPDDLDAFIEETKEKFSIDAVLNTVSDFGYGIDWMKDGDEMLEKNYERFASEGPFYVLVLDNEWYTTVSKPLESVRNVLGIFLLVVLIGSAVVLALVVLLSLRGRQREFGVLLAMGERTHKITGQVFLEILVPLLIAAVLGTLLGTQILVPMAEEYSSSLLSTQSREDQTDLRESSKDLTKSYFGATGRYSYMPDDLRFRSPRTIAVVNSVPYKAGVEVYGTYFGLDFGMVILILMVQMLSVLRVKPARILTRRE